MIGKKIGKLIVLGFDENKKGLRDKYWSCRCECGNFTSITTGDINRGHKKSCGCLHKYKKGEGNLNTLFGHYIHFANKRELDFELDFEDFRDLTQQNCYWCGTTPKQKMLKPGSNGDYTYNGVDRKNNSLGYTVENSVPCCGACNKAKSALTEIDFIFWIKSVYQHITSSNFGKKEQKTLSIKERVAKCLKAIEWRRNKIQRLNSKIEKIRKECEHPNVEHKHDGAEWFSECQDCGATL